MYWLPKMHKTPIGAIFIVVLKNCSAKLLSSTISKIFKNIFSTVENSHNKCFFHSGCWKFWIVLIFFPIVTKLNKINVKKKAKSISTFSFSTLYTTILHKLLMKVPSEIINLVFKSKVKKRIGSFLDVFIGLLRKLEEDTSLNKLLSVLCIFS